MKFLKNSKGFTLIEIISVILVLGIISAVAIPMLNTGTIDINLAANTVQTDIQYVQELAMTRDQDVSITFTQGSTTYDVPADPNGVYSLETRQLPQGTAINSTNTTVTFNGNGELTGGAAQTIQLVAGTSSDTINVTVEAYTGRVTVQ